MKIKNKITYINIILDYRNVKRNEEFGKKVEAIFDSNAQMLDSSSDEDDLEDLVKNNDNKISKKIGNFLSII